MLFPLLDLGELCAVKADPVGGLPPCSDSATTTVTFASKVDVKPIPNLCTILSDKQKLELWYPDPPDENEPKRKKSVLRLLLCSSHQRNDHDDGGEISATAKMSHSDTSPIKRNLLDSSDQHAGTSGKKKFPVEAVLMEQEYQRYEGSSDPEMISKLYTQCSAHSVARAQMRALQHELDIRNYVMDRGTRRQRKQLKQQHIQQQKQLRPSRLKKQSFLGKYNHHYSLAQKM